MKDSLNIAIAGATGYVGLELIKILSNHPKANIVYLCAQKSIGKPISVFDKKIKKKNYQKFLKLKKLIGARSISFLLLFQAEKLKKLQIEFQTI